MAVLAFLIIVMLDGKTGEMQLHLNVYKQKTCKICGHDIEQKVIASRNSHFVHIVRNKGE